MEKITNDYMKAPLVNTGLTPGLEENEELNKTIPEKGKRV